MSAFLTTSIFCPFISTSTVDWFAFIATQIRHIFHHFSLVCSSRYTLLTKLIDDLHFVDAISSQQIDRNFKWIDEIAHKCFGWLNEWKTIRAKKCRESFIYFWIDWIKCSEVMSSTEQKKRCVPRPNCLVSNDNETKSGGKGSDDARAQNWFWEFVYFNQCVERFFSFISSVISSLAFMVRSMSSSSSIRFHFVDTKNDFDLLFVSLSMRCNLIVCRNREGKPHSILFSMLSTWFVVARRHADELTSWRAKNNKRQRQTDERLNWSLMFASNES